MEYSDNGGMAAAGGVIGVIYLAFFVLIIASMWKIFTKAGKPGWAAIIPIYNLVVLLEIVGKPVWWIILLLIPLVNFIIIIVLYHKLAQAFGQGVGMTIGLLLVPFICFPIMGFSSSITYQGAPA